MSKDHPRNQLDSVICQIRFPATLIIERDIASFEQSISPEYKLKQLSAIQPNVANMPLAKDYVFVNDDESWSVSISIATLSLSTNKYVDWPDFSSRLERLFESFSKCFKVKDVMRIGLRFINAIRPSTLGCKAGDLTGLIKPQFTKGVISDSWGVQSFSMVMDSIVREGVNCRTVYGTIQFADPNGEQGFLIDNDIYTMDKYGPEQLMSVLNEFHGYSESAFRSIATDQLQRGVGL